jgi:hypothetical protein
MHSVGIVRGDLKPENIQLALHSLWQTDWPINTAGEAFDNELRKAAEMHDIPAERADPGYAN